MKLETFLERFDQFADLPEAIARIRVLILQLAVRGRLVNQNSDDGTGRMLLEKIRRTNTVEPIPGDEQLFSIPASWVWTRLGEVGSWGSGSTPSRSNPELYGGGIIWLKSGELNDEGELTSSEETISELALETGSFRRNHAGDVLIAMYGATIGKVAILAKPAVTNQAICGCTPAQGVLNRYLFYYLISQRDNFHAASEGGAQPNISKVKIINYPFPLPSTAEQKRIVAKVDELMAICDRLEEQQKERVVRQVALSRAAVARFENVPTPANLNLLFHGSYSIEPADLRKVILNLAVRGKLVPQDFNDEPVNEMLERILEERRYISKTSSLKTQTISSDCCLGYDIPDSWSWQALEDILVSGPTNGFSPKAVDYETPVRSLTLSATTSGRFKGEHSKFIAVDVPSDSDLWLRDGDMLIQRGNTLEYVGVPAVYRGEPNRFIYPDLMMKIRVSSEVDVDFVHLAMLSEPSREYLRKRASGTSGSMPKINQSVLKSLPIPLAPPAEQRRIVERVRLLLGLVDQLEGLLASSQTKSRELLDAIVQKLLAPDIDRVEITQGYGDRVSDRAGIGCYSIQSLMQNPNFGRTMLMKVCYLSETHLGLSLGWQPMRHAAGPYDSEVETFESLGKSNGWFTVTEKNLNNGHTKIEYHAEAGLKAKAAEAVTVLGNKKAEFDRLLKLFADKSTEEAEIIATLFAAWNDFLIDGKSPTDDEIIREVRENWHPVKQRFSASRLLQWLRWMRRNNLVPQGRGPHTRQQLKLALS